MVRLFLIIGLLASDAAVADAQSPQSELGNYQLVQNNSVFLPGERNRQITNSIGMKLVLIPNGKFEEWLPTFTVQPPLKPEQQRSVTISRPFYISIYEVTQAEYFQVMANNPSKWQGNRIKNLQTPHDLDNSQYPVDQVSWYAATEFCRRLTQFPKEISAGRRYRLPTSAEWEYACRAGSDTMYGFDQTRDSIDELAWHSDNSGGRSHAVGQKKPNAFGLFDMHGNVEEWCLDGPDYFPEPKAVTDPYTKAGPTAVVRGKSYDDRPRSMHCVWFSSAALRTWDENRGFRVVVETR
jgi:formylglycine-generating enzyme required for sulfatase activity